ncbi:MAG: hypothetical protein ACXIU8_14250 [Alkalilacustris sp.]
MQLSEPSPVRLSVAEAPTYRAVGLDRGPVVVKGSATAVPTLAAPCLRVDRCKVAAPVGSSDCGSSILLKGVSSRLTGSGGSARTGAVPSETGPAHRGTDKATTVVPSNARTPLLSADPIFHARTGVALRGLCRVSDVTD